MTKPNPLAAAQSKHEVLLDEIIAEISERLRSGVSIDIEQYADKHPEIAPQLRQLYPAMQAMANLGFEPAATISPAGTNSSEAHRQLGTLGDFRLLREVGRGGMGVVYEAQQISLSRNVALKVLPFAAMLDDRHIQRFKNEALAAAQLDHPHIVDVYGVGCDRSVHYYAMRYVEGTTLADVIKGLHAKQPWTTSSSGRSRSNSRQTQPQTSETQAGEPAPSSRAQASIDTSAMAAITTNLSKDSHRFIQAAARIGIEVAEALDHAHEQGVIHRDIKPANILLDHNTKTWVTDFGLARIEADASMTMTGDLLGTARYMSPEQAMAKRVLVDHRTDIYSLGVTLYELVTLQPAFPDNDRQELMRKITFEEPAIPRKLNRAITEELETIILKASAKNPAERYATAADLAEDLKCFLDNKPIQARRPNALQRLTKWSQRHRAAVLTTGLVASLLLFFGIGLLAISNRMISEQRDAKDDALAAATQNLEKAERETNRARREQRRAEGNLELAISALDKVYFQAIGEDRLLGPDDAWRERRPLTPKEQRLLATGLEFYGQLVGGNADSPVVLHQHAKAYERIADLHIRLGNTDLARKAYQDAIGCLTELTRTMPSNAEYYADLGNAYFNISYRTEKRANESDFDYKPAFDAYQAGLEIDPENAVILFRRAWSHHLVSERELAVRDAERAVQLAPDKAHYHDLMTLILLGSGDPDVIARAKGHAEAAVRLKPDDARSRIRLATTLKKNGDLESALEQIQVAIRLDPSEPNAQVHLARILRETNRCEEALTAIENAVEMSPHDGFAFLERGMIHQAKGELDLAAKDLTRAIELVPGNSVYLKRRAEVYAKLGETQKALSDCDTVGRLTGSEQASWYNGFRTNALVQLERWEEAGKQADQWVVSQPRNSWAYHQRALIHFRLGKYDEGVADLGERLKLATSSQSLNRAFLKKIVAGGDESLREHFFSLSEADLDASEQAEVMRALRAQLLHDSESYQELENECTRLIEVNPKGHYYYYLRSFARSSMDNDRLALEDLERAVDLLPDDQKEIGLAYRYFQQRGELLVRSGEPRRAAADFSVVLKHHPSFIHDIKRRGWAYFRAGEYDLSIADLQEAVRERPDDLSNLMWVSTATIADCPDADFREEYLKLADEMVRLNDSSSGARGTRAAIHASFGEFEQALTILETLISEEEATHHGHYHFALLALAIDDPAKYRAACQRMLKTSLESEEVGNLVLTGWTCTLSPDSLTDYSTAIEAVKRAKENDPQSLLAHQASGGLLLRAGEYKSALNELQQAKTIGEADGESSAYTDYLLAIAHHRLKDSASAQAALDEANSTAELELANVDRPATWNGRLTLKLLREEAERAIQADDDATRNEGGAKKKQN